MLCEFLFSGKHNMNIIRGIHEYEASFVLEQHIEPDSKRARDLSQSI